MFCARYALAHELALLRSIVLLRQARLAAPHHHELPKHGESTQRLHAPTGREAWDRRSRARFRPATAAQAARRSVRSIPQAEPPPLQRYGPHRRRGAPLRAVAPPPCCGAQIPLPTGFWWISFSSETKTMMPLFSALVAARIERRDQVTSSSVRHSFLRPRPPWDDDREGGVVTVTSRYIITQHN